MLSVLLVDIRAQTGVPQSGFHVLGVVNRQVHAAGTAVFVAEPFDRAPHGGGVDDGHHLGDVFGEQPVEQHLVAVGRFARYTHFRRSFACCWYWA